MWLQACVALKTRRGLETCPLTATLSLSRSPKMRSSAGERTVASETHVGCGAVPESQRVPFNPERLWKQQQSPFVSICGLISSNSSASPFPAPHTKHRQPQRLQIQTLFPEREKHQDQNTLLSCFGPKHFSRMSNLLVSYDFKPLEEPILCFYSEKCLSWLDYTII